MEPAGEPTEPSDTVSPEDAVLPENDHATQTEDGDDESVTCSISLESRHGSTEESSIGSYVFFTRPYFDPLGLFDNSDDVSNSDDWNTVEVVDDAELWNTDAFIHQSDHSEIELSEIIPQPYLNLVVNDLASRNVDSTPDEVHRALGDAINEVEQQEKWEVKADEDPLVTAERISNLRAVDEERSVSGPSFSRACGVCFAENPGARAILTACGHIVCAACAVTMARAERVICPFCRAFTGYVLMVEEEDGAPAANVIEKKVEDVADDTAASLGAV